ncbi:MAG: FtsX-like permease family protein, partial [Candidatus Heimdallarchaeota archaeon]
MPILTRNLLKKLLRDVGKNKLLFTALISLNILGVTAYVSFVLGYQSLEISYQQFYDDYSFHDIEIQASEGIWINESLLQKVGEDFKNLNPEIERINHRIIVESGYNISKDEFIHGEGQIIGFDTDIPMNQRLNKLYIEEGSTFLPGEQYSNKVILNAQFADRMEIGVGDTILIGLGSLREVEVLGVAYSVEHIVVIPSRYGSVFPLTRFGIFFMPKIEVQNALQLDGKVNDLIMTFTEDTSYKTRIKISNEFSKLIESELQVTLNEPVPQELQISNWFLRLNVEGFREISEVLPVFVLAVTSLAIFITQNRLINSQRRQIGIALSLGYYPRDLFLHYLSYVAMVGVVGGVLGLFGGFITAKIIAEGYASAIALPFTKIAFNPSVLIFGFFSAFFVGLLGGIIPAWKGSRMKPREAMASYSTVSFFLRGSFLWKLISKLSIKAHLKLPLRNIMRNPWRSTTNLIGLTASVAILVLSLTLFDSASGALNSEFHEISDYDLEISFGTPKLGELGLYDDLEILQKMRTSYGIEAVDCALEIPTIFYREDGRKSNEGMLIAFNSTTPSTHHFRFDNRYSSEWEDPNSSIILTSGLANYFGLQSQSGAQITITHPGLPISSLEELWLEGFFQQEGKNATLDFLKNQLQQASQVYSYNQSDNFFLVNSTLSIGGISKETWGTLSYISLRKMSDLMGFGLFENFGIDLTPVSKIFIKLNSEGRMSQTLLRDEIISQLDVQSVLFIE